jgi:ribonuclease Z
MELYFLGTGAGLPSKHRNVSSVALLLHAERGSFWLFDVGEGTQHQLMRSPLKPAKLEYVFITHLHGDHVFGLPGLLTSRSHQGGQTPVRIFGPAGTRTFVMTALDISETRLDYALEFEEVGDGWRYEDDQCIVHAHVLEHRITSYGYRIEEKAQHGMLDAARLRSLGLEPGPLYARIKRGETVVLPDGTHIDGKTYCSPPIPGRIVTICGDTRPCDAVVSLARDADVLVHEATYAHERAEQAKVYYHATAREVALMAKEAHVQTLIMTHISSRYQEEQLPELRAEALDIMPSSYVAEDHWSYVIPRKQ